MHEACGLAHGQCTPRVAWPLFQASPVLHGVAQRRTHTNSAMVLYKIILFCCKQQATSTLLYEVSKGKA